MQNTENYRLRKPETTDYIAVGDLNYNADVIDAELKKQAEGISDVKYHITNLESEVEATKKSVSDGKSLVANAITAKGVNTATSATFATMATNISQIETGTDTSDATATASQILSGKTAYGSTGKLTGTMTNNGAKTATLNAGGSYTIPAGYHNGSGKITANSLASQTVADATAETIADGKTAWVNGVKITGTADIKERVYLYNEGDECTSLTGGWMIPTSVAESHYCDMVSGVSASGTSPYGTRTVQKNSNHLYINVTTNTKNMVVQGSLYTAKTINLSPYNTLYVKYTTSSISGSGVIKPSAIYMMDVTPNKLATDNYYNHQIVKLTMSASGSENVVSVNISNVTASLYAQLTIILWSETDNSLYGNVKIHSIWLE